METRTQYVQRKRRENEAERRLAEAAEWGEAKLHDFDNNGAAKAVVGDAAEVPGIVFGVGRGVGLDLKAIKDGAGFAWDLANPLSAHHDDAVATGRDLVAGGAGYVASRAADPALIGQDVSALRDRLNRNLNPGATAVAPTMQGEIARRFALAANQGELGWNVASLALPLGGELKSAQELGRFAPRGAAKYLAMNATPGEAERFAQLYNGLGHHAFIPRNATWDKVPGVGTVGNLLGIAPETLQGRVPKWLVDSPFNVLKPNVETGQFYRLHFGVDDNFNGGKVGRAYGGTSWSGKGFNWEKYGKLKRLVYGTPGATKAVGLGGPAVLDGVGRVTDPGGAQRR